MGTDAALFPASGLTGWKISTYPYPHPLSYQLLPQIGVWSYAWFWPKDYKQGGVTSRLKFLCSLPWGPWRLEVGLIGASLEDSCVESYLICVRLGVSKIKLSSVKP